MTPSLRLLTFTEAARLVGCSARTIKRWAERGMFPVTVMNGRRRVREPYLRKAIEQRTRIAGEP